MAAASNSSKDKEEKKSIITGIQLPGPADADSALIDLQLYHWVKLRKEMAQRRARAKDAKDSASAALPIDEAERFAYYEPVSDKDPTIRALLMDEEHRFGYYESIMVDIHDALYQATNAMVAAVKKHPAWASPIAQHFLDDMLYYLRDLRLRSNNKEKFTSLLAYLDRKSQEITHKLSEVSDPAAQQLLGEYLECLAYLKAIIVDCKGAVFGNCHLMEAALTLAGEIDRLPYDAKQAKVRDGSAPLARDLEYIAKWGRTGQQWNRTEQQLAQAIPPVISGQSEESEPAASAAIPQKKKIETLNDVFERIFTRVFAQYENLGLGLALELEVAAGGKILRLDPRPEHSVILFCEDDVELGKILAQFSERLFPPQRQITLRIMPLYEDNEIFNLHINGHSVSVTSTDQTLRVADQIVRGEFPRAAHGEIAKRIFDTRRHYYLKVQGSLGFLIWISVRKPLLAPEIKSGDKLELKTPATSYPLAQEILAMQALNPQQKGSLLLVALQHGDRAFAIHLLKSKGDVDVNIMARNNNDIRPLLIAAASGDVEILRLLLLKGASLRVENAQGENAMILAAKYHHFNAVDLLWTERNCYEEEAPLCNRGKTINASNAPTVQLCREYQEIKNMPKAQQAIALLTLFHKAIVAKNIELTQRLLTENTSLLTTLDSLALFIADDLSPANFKEILKIALPIIAPAIPERRAFLDWVIKELLRKMAAGGAAGADLEKLYALISYYGGGMDASRVLSGFFQYYIERAAEPDRLHIAVAMTNFFGHLQLLDYRYFVDYYISLIEPPEDQYARLSELLKMDTLHPNAIPVIKFSALQYALKHNPSLLEEMVAAYPDAINLQDKRGNTALHLAVLEGNEAIVDFLLDQRNIQRNIKNNQGQMPHELPGVSPRIGAKLAAAAACQPAAVIALAESKAPVAKLPAVVAAAATRRAERKMQGRPVGSGKLLAASLPSAIVAAAPPVSAPVSGKEKADAAAAPAVGGQAASSPPEQSALVSQ